MNTKKAYIAAPFRSLTDRESAPKRAYGELISEAAISRLESIENVLLAAGYHTCLPHRDEGEWGAVYYDPEPIARLCLRHVDTSQLMVAVPGKSRGVHIEMGRASAMGIPIIAFVVADEEYSTLLPGLGQASPFTRQPSAAALRIIEVGEPNDIPERLAEVLELGGSSPTDPSQQSAVVDIGSNSIKMSIYSVAHGRSPIVLAFHRHSIALSEGITSAEGVRTEKAMELRRVLQQLRHALDQYPEVGCVRVVGTAALRRLDDPSEIAGLVTSALGAELQILSQADEAKHVAAAVQQSLNKGQRVAALNLGASSVQLTRNIDDSDIGEPALYNFGTLDLIRDFPWEAPMDADTWNNLLATTRNLFAQQPPPSSQMDPTTYMYHTGGELDFLMRVRAPLETCWLSPTHVSKISLEQFEAFGRSFCALDPAVVSATTGLQGGWLAGAVASNAIAIAAMSTIGADYLVPSNLNLADGLL